LVEGFSDKIEDAERVPAEINVLSPDLGIINIQFYQDLQQYVYQIIPSPVDNIPFIAFAELDQHIWEQASLSEDFDLSVLMSVIFSVPNNDARLEQRQFTPESLGHAEGNPQLIKEIFSRRQTAGYRWTDSSRATLTPNGVEVTGSILENEEVIDAISRAEADRFLFHMKDRAIGSYALTGWETVDFYPSGNAQSVDITFRSGGLFTNVDLSNPPLPKTFMELLPSNVRKFLFRQLPRI
jgi:hypothetical protein